ncbi:MAG: hypothetical protein ACRDC3_05875, partial [Paraclostridium dentum]|uniref:hypothetical protein n=1 Tax=Paraclostridium dentum TaxID=2662455 RepID=UPI003EE7CD8A
CRSIKVVDLNSGDEREHNPNHYDGDTTEGFICFNTDVIEILRNYYFFYDLHIFDKDNIENRYLIDVLDDKVVFWEGEYNKLPRFIKDKIDIYNFVPEIKNGIISQAMSAMQLEVDWNWNEKLSPDYKLANAIREVSFNRALDLGITFITPNNIEEMKHFILNIEKLKNIKLERFNTRAKDVSILIKIRDEIKLDEDIKDLQLLYKKYCYAIYREMKNEE